MIRNYLRIAFRNLVKHRVFSLINIFGLGIGIAAPGHIYRLQLDRYQEGKLSTQWAAGAAGIGTCVSEAFPEITSVARLRGMAG